MCAKDSHLDAAQLQLHQSSPSTVLAKELQGKNTWSFTLCVLKYTAVLSCMSLLGKMEHFFRQKVNGLWASPEG